MAGITLKGNPIHTIGELPAVGSEAPDFALINGNLEEVTLTSLGSTRKVLNVFPSIDTPVCAMSVRKFNEEAAKLDNTVVLNISADLPFAQQRFCGAEGIENAQTLSCFRSPFPEDYGLLIVDGPIAGLCSRCVIILDGDNKVIYTEQVAEIAEEPDYEKALSALK
ncbi:MAG: thiol peroxidase [Planctomycetes bacterium]|nr:thiol peroxidase [Planctomycetota bacterium]